MHQLLTERPNLFEPNNQMAFYLEIDKVNVDTFKEAIYKAYLNNETTCCKIVLKNNGKAYYQKMNTTACTIEITDKDWKNIINEQEKIPFALNEGEMVRCFIRDFDDKTGLLIYAHHLVGDGKAMMCFINDIMNALINNELTYKPLKLLDRADITQDYQLPTIAKLYTTFTNFRYKLLGNKVYSWDDYNNINNHYWKQYKSKITCHTFNQEETKKIKELSKLSGVSVNSYLTTAFIQNDNEEHTIGMITSLREKDNHTMANLISGISSSQQYQADLSFEDNAKIVHKQIQRSLDKYRYFVINFMSDFFPSLIDGILIHAHGFYQNLLLEEVSRITGYKGNFTRDIGITNLTVLDVPHKFNEYTIHKLLVVAPLISYTRKVVCVSTFNNELTLAYHDMIKDEKPDDEFFNKIITNIQNCINTE